VKSWNKILHDLLLKTFFESSKLYFGFTNK